MYFSYKILDQNPAPKSNNNPSENNKIKQSSEKKVLASKTSLRQKKSTQVVVEKKEEIIEVDVEVNHEKSTVKNSHAGEDKQQKNNKGNFSKI